MDRAASGFAMAGTEWLVEACGCAPAVLVDLDTVRALFDAIVADLGLRPVGDALWHRFPEPGGITGVRVLAESHLACHTFPEHGSICLNLFCCAPRPAWDFDGELRRRLGAAAVRVRRIERAYAAAADGVASVAAEGADAEGADAEGVVSDRVIAVPGGERAT